MCAFFFLTNLINSWLLIVGSLQSEALQCVAISKKTVYASCGRTVKAFHRGKEVRVYHGQEGDVHTIIPFGDHLLTIDAKNIIRIWHALSAGEV